MGFWQAYERETGVQGHTGKGAVPCNWHTQKTMIPEGSFSPEMHSIADCVEPLPYEKLKI